LVLLGGETLRPFSLALLLGILFGTYDTIAVAGPIMVWWERKLEAANKLPATTARDSALQSKQVRGSSKSVGKPSRAA
jgi:preprotein translocase subunit SecF